MKISHVAAVILALFVMKKWEQGRHTDKMKSEVMPNDPYQSVTNIWEALNGGNLRGDGKNPVASPAYVQETTTGQPIGLSKVGMQ